MLQSCLQFHPPTFPVTLGLDDPDADPLVPFSQWCEGWKLRHSTTTEVLCPFPSWHLSCLLHLPVCNSYIRVYECVNSASCVNSSRRLPATLRGEISRKYRAEHKLWRLKKGCFVKRETVKPLEDYEEDIDKQEKLFLSLSLRVPQKRCSCYAEVNRES